ncbi:unnamed protein product [Onchocerca flexuosa]|uniref:7TM_GPCR_Srx domain-containing protein n=1 Tax=Onchocerca flexuosa TaxID=387005 RepID=A0A183HUW4_9BILA|nr:unnamed protein product [Onchocerca flexuosa]
MQWKKYKERIAMGTSNLNLLSARLLLVFKFILVLLLVFKFGNMCCGCVCFWGKIEMILVVVAMIQVPLIVHIVEGVLVIQFPAA